MSEPDLPPKEFKDFKSMTSATMPFRTQRQFRMLEGFQDGLYEDLHAVMISIAQQDHYISTTKPIGATRSGLAASSVTFVDDHCSGLNEIRTLLSSIEKSVVLSLINQTTAYQYKNDANFRRHFYRTDQCPGAYLVSLLVDGENKGFTPNELKKIIRIMKSYFNGHNKKVDRFSDAADSADAALAFRLEENYLSPTFDENQIKEAINAGKRKMVFSQKDRFLELLDERSSEEIDPSGETRQFQSIVQVECSTNMKNGMIHHNPKLSSMQSSSNPLKLLIAAAKEAGIKIEIISLPIIKVWEKSQLPKAEILLTMLSGSMVWDGGLNVVEPGTNKGEKEGWDGLHISKMTIPIEAPWFMENLVAIQERCLAKCVALTVATGTIPAVSIQKADELIQKFDQLSEDMDKELQKANEFCAYLQEIQEQGEKALATIQSNIRILEDSESLDRDILALLDGQL